MASVVQMKYLPRAAGLEDAWDFFRGLEIVPGGVYIGTNGLTFISFDSCAAAHAGARRTSQRIKGQTVALSLCTPEERDKRIQQLKSATSGSDVDLQDMDNSSIGRSGSYSREEYPSDPLFGELSTDGPHSRDEEVYDTHYSRPMHSAEEEAFPAGTEHQRGTNRQWTGQRENRSHSEVMPKRRRTDEHFPVGQRPHRSVHDRLGGRQQDAFAAHPYPAEEESYYGRMEAEHVDFSSQRLTRQKTEVSTQGLEPRTIHRAEVYPRNFKGNKGKTMPKQQIQQKWYPGPGSTDKYVVSVKPREQDKRFVTDTRNQVEDENDADKDDSSARRKRSRRERGKDKEEKKSTDKAAEKEASQSSYSFLRIDNVDKGITYTDLKEFFGGLSWSFASSDVISGPNLSSAYLRFADPKSFEVALKMNGLPFLGKKVSVVQCLEKEYYMARHLVNFSAETMKQSERKSQRYSQDAESDADSLSSNEGRKSTEGRPSVLVSNLWQGATKMEILELLHTAGVKVKLNCVTMCSSWTRFKKCVAFVELDSGSDVSHALTLDNLIYRNVKLTVFAARRQYFEDNATSSFYLLVSDVPKDARRKDIRKIFHSFRSSIPSKGVVIKPARKNPKKSVALVNYLDDVEFAMAQETWEDGIYFKGRCLPVRAATKSELESYGLITSQQARESPIKEENDRHFHHRRNPPAGDKRYVPGPSQTPSYEQQRFSRYDDDENRLFATNGRFVRVSQLPHWANEAWLYHFFEDCGIVESSIHIIYLHKFPYRAYLECTTREGVQKACRKDGTNVDGGFLKVEHLRNEEPS